MFLIASKVLLISLSYVIFHMSEVFVFASFPCYIAISSLALKLNILDTDTPQGKLNTSNLKIN